MDWLNALQIKANNKSEYPTGEHGRTLFTEHINNLYQFAFLFTSDREKAEQCFAAGLEDCVNGNPVFQEWADSWTRSVIDYSFRTEDPYFKHGMS